MSEKIQCGDCKKFKSNCKLVQFKEGGGFIESDVKFVTKYLCRGCRRYIG